MKHVWFKSMLREKINVWTCTNSKVRWFFCGLYYIGKSEDAVTTKPEWKENKTVKSEGPDWFSMYHERLNLTFLIDVSEDDMQNSFTYNIGAGFNVKLNDRISFDAKYRYVNFGDLYDDYGLTVPATGNEFLAGIRLEF